MNENYYTWVSPTSLWCHGLMTVVFPQCASMESTEPPRCADLSGEEPVASPAEEALRGLRGAAERAGWRVPTPLTQSTARTVLAQLLRVVERAGLHWKHPHISGGPSGTVAIEWWSRPRDLTLYIDGESIRLVRSWGTSIAHEMSDGTLDPNDAVALLNLWRWLELSDAAVDPECGG